MYYCLEHGSISDADLSSIILETMRDLGGFRVKYREDTKVSLELIGARDMDKWSEFSYPEDGVHSRMY